MAEENLNLVFYRHWLPIVAAGVLFATGPLGQADTMYRCVDEFGSVTFSDQPCNGGDEFELLSPSTSEVAASKGVRSERRCAMGGGSAESVADAFIDLSINGDAVAMLELTTPSGKANEGTEQIRQYFVRVVVPFFSEHVKLHNVKTINISAVDNYGHKGISFYMYSVTKSGSIRPFVIQIVNEADWHVVSRIYVDHCFPGPGGHPFC